MNTGTVSGISPYVDPASAHSVSDSIADVSVNNNPAVIHRIADSILRIGADCDGSAVQVGAKRVAGDSGDRDIPVLHTGSDKTLAAAAFDPAVTGIPAEDFVQCLMI
jgi:hypothetical protein